MRVNENFLRSALAQGQFFYSAELVLGRDHAVAEAETFVKEASRQPDGIRVISVTDLPGGNPALPPEAFVSYIAEHNLTPIAHLTGKDGNRSFLEGRLHALARMGVENILALTGDAQKDGFAGRAKPVHDLDSVLILWLIQAMRNGISYSLGSRTVQSTPYDFLAGAVVNPFKVRQPDLMMQLYKLELKIVVRAQFIITQLGFNLRKLFELKQYLVREGLERVPVLANVYVPTATIARMMQTGELAGCVVPDALIRRLEVEKKPERLERAALTVAAAKDLGFAGAHIGGFGLSHRDFMTIIERASAIGKDWRKRMDELVFEYPNEFYLLPPGKDGLSDGAGSYQLTRIKSGSSWKQRFSLAVHRHLVAPPAGGRGFLAAWPVVQAARAVLPLPKGDARVRELRRLHSGPPELRGLLDAVVLQGTAQRALRRLPGGRNLRGSLGSAVHLQPRLSQHPGAGRGPQEVCAMPGSTERLVPGPHQRAGQPPGWAGQSLQENSSAGRRKERGSPVSGGRQPRGRRRRREICSS
jgi:methylenetetrahydrofolate reductase (NADPH)